MSEAWAVPGATVARRPEQVNGAARGGARWSTVGLVARPAPGETAMSTPPPQNAYDDPDFFAGYARLERFGAGWTKAVEQPSFMALLPDVAGRRVLDLGCGAGYLAHHLAERGAAEVLAVDLSERMLAVARAERGHPRVTYQRGAMEEVDYPADRFDLVVSSLAIHYVGDYRALMARVARWLARAGHLVYSTEHPIYLTRAAADGWVRDTAGAI